MEAPSRPIRVLVRPPPAPTLPLFPQHRPPQPPPLPSTEPSSSTNNGVVVVGFIGKRHHDVAHFINKIIDSHVFGSGNLDKPFRFEPEKLNPEMMNWLESTKLSFHHDDGQGFVYVQFSSLCCPVAETASFESRVGFEHIFDEQELLELEGLLFMFSVCHIIVFIQEGSRFDIQMLKKFRLLQAAKHKIAPFVRSQNMSPVTSRPHSSSHSRISVSGASSITPFPGKDRRILNRNNSSVSLLSVLGSHTSLLPGQCTPVILFVFLDDFAEIHPCGNVEEPSGTSSPSLKVTKSSSEIVMLSRPVPKSVVGLKKKLQSSLEAQIRFSLKKCRILSGSESSYGGLRSGSISSSAPIFALDASKAVSLVDAFSIQSGESLEFAIGLLEEVLVGKATPDSLLTGSRLQPSNEEDIVSVKEFISRQSGLLRGRGGLAANSSISAPGVGIFAAAAAAAAASASASPSAAAAPPPGKTVIAHELPNFNSWSSSSLLILHGIISAKRNFACESEIRNDEENIVLASSENLANVSGPFESALSHLKVGIGLNNRFSTLWCQKSFPVAKKIYLDNLPPCYPSSQHEEHLKMALHTLTSMVKGSAVPLYMKKLKDDCTYIWTSGRQLCDAISLTGKPCRHQRHDVKTSADESKPHSSGYVYLHACACGRSRKLRPDPFDYETANVAYDTFADCDKLLPSIQLPELKSKAIPPSSWSLIRLGGAKYYKPSKGLLQSGFCKTQKFLQRWTVGLGKLKETSHLPDYRSQQISLDGTKVEAIDNASCLASDAARLGPELTETVFGIKLDISSAITEDSSKDIRVGRGLSNVKMRKPFAEVVAGPAFSQSGIPPLLLRKQPLLDGHQGPKLQRAQGPGRDKIGEVVPYQESPKVENGTLTDKKLKGNGIDINASSHVSSSVIPVDITADDDLKADNSMKRDTIYVGFEHECPHGHRFMLNVDHLKELGSPYSVPEEAVSASYVENSKEKRDPVKLGKIRGQGRNLYQINGINMGSGSGKTQCLGKTREKVTNGNTVSNKSVLSAAQMTHIEPGHCFEPISIGDGGGAISLLDRCLPLYMNCPHCRSSSTQDEGSNKFAGTISQLQRIFVVTPSYPVVLALDPIIQFELPCLPASIPNRQQKLKFSLTCPVILPPESFLSLRLPFIYGVELENENLTSLKPLEDQPQHTACLVKGTALQIVSNRNNLDQS